MIEWRLRRQIDRARLRWRHARLVEAVTLVWIGGALLAGLFLWGQWFGGSGASRSVEWIAVLAATALLAGVWWAVYSTADRRLTARRIEATFPELKTALLAALDIQPDAQSGRVGYLEDRVVGQVLSHAYQHDWQRVVPLRRVAGLHGLHLFSLICFGLLFWQLHVQVRNRIAAQPAEDSVPLILADGEFDVSIEPGNTEIERGTSLLVSARFQGPLPPQAVLVYRPTTSATREVSAGENAVSEPVESRVTMSKALDDPLFGGSIGSVAAPLEYFVEFAGRRTQAYQVAVFEYPRMVRADAKLKFPQFTSMADKLVRDMRQVTAVVGTEITVSLELNKAVASAKLVEKLDDGGVTFDLTPVPDLPTQYRTTFTLEQTMRMAVQLVDAQGRANKEMSVLTFTALANQPPDLKLAAPGKDTQVSPLEELQLKAKAFDDFGLSRVGVTYSLAGQDEKELVLAQQVPGKERLELSHLVPFEDLGAEPDQLLSYYFWAEDAGAGGVVRRTSSDMFFAEVRPFEEIFRQGQQPPGGESQQRQQQSSRNANEAERLAELQKEIMNATWKLIRRETGTKPSDPFSADVGLLVESQRKALELTEQLAERVQDAQAMRHVDNARRHMNDVIEKLMSADEKKSPGPLTPALGAEQQAYQTLLKLRAREHEVIRGQRQRGGGGGGGSSRSQQQLEQLELRDQENRYEAERTAQAPEDPVEREMRQVLNRLKELAQRQGDLNERLREMQAALQAAETEVQKEELRRQLKRLQEEQEQLLRDTEELQARMDQPRNAERMADSRQQLDDARERVRQSSEALREGIVSQATSAGARAEEDFEQLRDEFRRQTSDRFQQDARELSEQARELQEREQQIAEQLRQLTEPQQPTRSLRETDERQQIVEGLGEQRQRSNELLERMRQTIQDAEGPQPLLAEQLYDTVRRTQQRNLEQNLTTLEEAVRRGLIGPARQQEEAAADTIAELRAGVDRAAESVLEGESEALRRAQGELETLSEQLRDELARNGQLPAEPGDREQGRSSEPGQQSAGQPKSGESKNPSQESRDGQQSRGGQQPQGGNRKGKSQGQDGKSAEQQQSEQSGENQGQSADSQQQGGQQQGGQQQGGQQQGGQQQRGDAQGGGDGSSPPTDNPDGQPRDGQRRRGPGDLNPARGGFDRLGGFTSGGGNERILEPFTGEDFRQWSDRLRDVEELLSNPDLSAEAARIRERARALRADSRRHSAPPNWDLVKLQVADPLAELLDRVRVEALKRTKSDSLVPLDRDPVAPEYAEQVRRYYERLGTGQ